MHTKITIILSLLPSILLTLLIIPHIPNIGYETIILVYSNLAMLPTVYKCIGNLKQSYIDRDFRHSFVIEFILSYSIIFVSGIYHLCDSSKICYGKFETLYYIDVTIAYTLIATYVFHIAQLNVMFKFLANVFQFIAFTWITQDNRLGEYILWFYMFPSAIFITKICERLYKKRFTHFVKSHDYKYLIIGCSLSLTGIIFGPLGIVKINADYYWIYHSILWHVPMMTASYFILQVSSRYTTIYVKEIRRETRQVVELSTIEYTVKNRESF